MADFSPREWLLEFDVEEMLDEDAMPRQKVEIDNKVCSQLPLINRATHPDVFL